MSLGKFILIAGASTLALSATAKVYTVDEIWKHLELNSGDIQASINKKESSKLELKRYKRHWLPKVQLTASQFQTNDPGGVFFNNLGQGAIEQSDFAPNLLNEPDTESFRNTSLKITLPLYEGGMKHERVKLGKKMTQSQSKMLKATKSKVYNELINQYGSALVLKKTQEQLMSLKTRVAKLLSRYELGRKSNLVGYSGLLGLQGVENRVEGLLAQKSAKLNHSMQWMQTMSGISESIQLKKMEISSLVDSKLKIKKNKKHSSFLESKKLQVKAFEHMPKMERARFLPQVGIFASKDYYHGDRDDNDSTSIGVYLGWDLFNNDSYGRVSEAKAKLMAAKAQVKSGQNQEQVARAALGSGLKALKNNIQITEKSSKLLDEQTQVAMKLFKSGKLTALQLAEVLNRRVDLIEQREKVNLEFLKVNGHLYKLNN